MARTQQQTKRFRLAAAGFAAALALLVVGGVAAHGGMLSGAFDPSGYLQQNADALAALENGSNAAYQNTDEQVSGKANLQDREAGQPQAQDVPGEAQATGSTVINVVDSGGDASLGLGSGGTQGAEQVTGPLVNMNGTDGNLPAGGGSASGNPSSPSTPTYPPGQDDPNDRPPSVSQPEALKGVTLLALNVSGQAVFKENDQKADVDEQANLAGVSVTAVLFDQDSGTKWSRSLPYGNVDGYTYTITSDSFKITPFTQQVTIAYYLYGTRYTANLPCQVGTALSASPDASFFDYLSCGQEVSVEDWNRYLAVTMRDGAASALAVDASSCDIQGFSTDAPGTRTATVTYAGLSASFRYTVKQRQVVYHTPEGLQGCAARVWGYDQEAPSPTGMSTRFNGTQSVAVELASTTVDVASMTQQLCGDLFWTQDPLGYAGGADPALTIRYVQENGYQGELDNWFVGWSVADPATCAQPLTREWLLQNLVESSLDVSDFAAIRQSQGTEGRIDLYPVMRSQTYLADDQSTLRYVEYFSDLGVDDSLSMRTPQQVLALAAVEDDKVSVPLGTTYVSNSPYLYESDPYAPFYYWGVASVELPLGLQRFDQGYPMMMAPYGANSAYGGGDAGLAFPNLADWSVVAAAPGHGRSLLTAHRTTVTHADGTPGQGTVLCDGEGLLRSIPAGLAGEGDSVSLAGIDFAEVDSNAIVGLTAGRLEFPRTLTCVYASAFMSSSVTQLIFNSAPVISGQAFNGLMHDAQADQQACAFTTMTFRTADIASMVGSSLYAYDDASLNTLAAMRQNGMHIQVPDQATLVRAYSSWCSSFDGLFGEGATAYLLQVEGSAEQDNLLVDDSNVVYRVGEDGTLTMLYAPPSLTGYYNLPYNVVALADGCMAQCSNLSGLIINGTQSGALPVLGAYAFGQPDALGYAAPPDIMKVYVARDLQGLEGWKEQCAQQYWKGISGGNDTLVELLFESSYDSYIINDLSLYGVDDDLAGEDWDMALALLRANTQAQGVFTLSENTSVIGSFAFAGCDQVTAVDNTDLLMRIESTAFLDCSKLCVISLPASLATIGDCAFSGCQALEALAFNGFTQLGDDLFQQGAVPRVYQPSDNAFNQDATQEAKDAFVAQLAVNGVADVRECPYEGGYYELLHSSNGRPCRVLCTSMLGLSKAQVTYVGSGYGDAFWGESADLNLNSNITELPDDVFAGQDKLASVNDGPSVTTLGDRAFSGCTSLTEVSLDWPFSSLNAIGEDCFKGCINLNLVSLPGSITDMDADALVIGNRAFKGCASLRAAYTLFDDCFSFPQAVSVQVGNEAFSGCESLTFTDSSGSPVPLQLEPRSAIGDAAFAGCASLTGYFHDGLSTLGQGVFKDCTGITYLGLSADTEIPAETFKGCTGLASLQVPDNLVIGQSAFDGCRLASLQFSQASTAVGAYAFANNPLAIVKLPAVTPGAFDATFLASSGVDVDGQRRIGMLLAQSATEQTFPQGFQQAVIQDAYVLPLDGETAEQVEARYRQHWTVQNVVNLNAWDLAMVEQPQGYVFMRGNQIVSATEDLTVLDATPLYSQVDPSQPVTIAPGAFANSNLTAIRWAQSENAALSDIGAAAFQNCTQLASVELPLTLQAIGAQAFAGCTALSDLSFSRGLLDGDPDYDSLTSAQDLTVGAHAFDGCTSLQELDLPVGNAAFEEASFANCTALRRIDCSLDRRYASLSLGADAFAQSPLSTVLLQGSSLAVESGAFTGARDLGILYLGAPDARIAADAFANACVDAYVGAADLSQVTVRRHFGNLPLDGLFTCDGDTTFVGYQYEDADTSWRRITTCTSGDVQHLSMDRCPSGQLLLGDSSFKGLASLENLSLQDNGTVFVTAIGDDAFKDCENLFTTGLSSDSMVSTIGARAFQNTGVIWLNVPDYLLSIGPDAFAGCSGLWEVSCSLSTGFLMPLTLGDGAFRDCEGLGRVVFDNRITFIGTSAFAGCTSLETVDFTSTNQESSFDQGMIDGTTNAEYDLVVAPLAFDGCTSLQALHLPVANVTFMGQAFANCTALATIDCLQDRRQATLSIGDGAFEDSPLTLISLPGSQVTLGSGSFASATNLAAFYAPDSLACVGDAFAQTQAAHVVGGIPSGLATADHVPGAGIDGIYRADGGQAGTYVAYAFDSASSSWERTIVSAGDDITEFNAYGLPASYYAVGDEAFRGCQQLASLMLDGYDATITAIGDRAFMECPNLVISGMGSTTPIQSIGTSAFEGCTSLSCGTDSADAIDIPQYVTQVGDRAFAGCTALEKVNHWCQPSYWDPLSPCTVGEQAFAGCASLATYDCSIYVTSFGPGCFQGCPNVNVITYWTGSYAAPDQFTLPTLPAGLFGLSPDGTSLKPAGCTLSVALEGALGGTAITQDQLWALFDQQNGWATYQELVAYAMDAA